MFVGKIPQVSVPRIEILVITILDQSVRRRKRKAAEAATF
jgi:hypothetical protein